MEMVHGTNTLEEMWEWVHVPCRWCRERVASAMNPINSTILPLQKGLRHKRSLACFLEAWFSLDSGMWGGSKQAVLFSFQTDCCGLDAPHTSTASSPHSQVSSAWGPYLCVLVEGGTCGMRGGKAFKALYLIFNTEGEKNLLLKTLWNLEAD